VWKHAYDVEIVIATGRILGAASFCHAYYACRAYGVCHACGPSCFCVGATPVLAMMAECQPTLKAVWNDEYQVGVLQVQTPKVREHLEDALELGALQLGQETRLAARQDM